MIYVDGTEKNPPDFVFKLQNLHIQNLLAVSISESGFGGNKFQLFGAFALVAGPQNLHLACWRYGQYHMKQRIHLEGNQKRGPRKQRSSKQIGPAHLTTELCNLT